MRYFGRRLLAPVCAFALATGGLSGALAQDRKGGANAGAIQSSVEITASVSRTAPDPAGGESRLPEIFNGGFANAAQQGGDSAFQFFSQEMSFDNRLVKGAPFFADTVSETIQTLPDGNRIVQRSEGRIYRDSLGRTRSERTYQMGGTSEQKQTINIYDPVIGASYSLDPETKAARKNSYIRIAPQTSPPPPP